MGLAIAGVAQSVWVTACGAKSEQQVSGPLRQVGC